MVQRNPVTDELKNRLNDIRKQLRRRLSNRKGTGYRRETPPSQFFRAGVGAVVTDRRDRVLALERSDVQGAWQLPQGGLERGEEPLEAVKREILEETGIPETELRLLNPEPRLLAYELPAAYRSRNTGRGQVLYWFGFRYQGKDEVITLGDRKEFQDWQWMSMSELLSRVVWFRKAVYRQLLEGLADPGRKTDKS